MRFFGGLHPWEVGCIPAWYSNLIVTYGVKCMGAWGALQSGDIEGDSVHDAGLSLIPEVAIEVSGG